MPGKCLATWWARRRARSPTGRWERCRSSSGPGVVCHCHPAGDPRPADPHLWQTGRIGTKKKKKTVVLGDLDGPDGHCPGAGRSLKKAGEDILILIN